MNRNEKLPNFEIKSPQYCQKFDWLWQFQFKNWTAMVQSTAPSIFTRKPLFSNCKASKRGMISRKKVIFLLMHVLNISPYSNRPLIPSSLVPLFQNESKCETFHIKMSSACSFIFMQIKVIFIRMVSHSNSLWNRGTCKGTRNYFHHGRLSSVITNMSQEVCGLTHAVGLYRYWKPN